MPIPSLLPSLRLLRRALAAGCLCLALAGLTPLTASASQVRPLAAGTRFSTPRVDPGAISQIRRLRLAGQYHDAARLQRMVQTPQAFWFTGGSPTEVEELVRQAVRRPGVPTLVVYNVPGRDCSQYSSGGAGSDAAYRAWVDGFAAGLPSTGRVVVVVEPDGLANLPKDCPGAYPGEDVDALTAGRIADIHYAGAAVLRANPDALVYLDAGNSNWHAVGDIAERLDQAGVGDFQGFSLNVSNYQPTPQQVQYGTWVAKCIYFAHNGAADAVAARYHQCASQYYPATASDYSTWHLTDEWYAAHVDSAPGAPTSSAQLAHLVVDTSRNGRGPWHPDTTYPDAQDWCNPPGRGVGLRPSARTSSELADAYLWVKTPGQSDGQCNRGVAGSSTDPVWGGIQDPAAGRWFPQQALELARLASPPLG